MRMRNCVHDIHTNIGNSEILDWKDHGFLVSAPQFPVTVPVSDKSCSAPLSNSCIGQLSPHYPTFTTQRTPWGRFAGVTSLPQEQRHAQEP